MAENPWQVVSEKPATQATDPWSVVSEKPAAPPPAAGGPAEQFAALRKGQDYAPPADTPAESPQAMEDRGNAALPPGAKQAAQVISPIMNAGVGAIKSATQGAVGEPEGASQKIGSAAEGVGEFVMGDEMAKSLSVAERLGIAQKLAKVAEESPIAGKLIKAGLNALRQGTVGGVQGLVKGESPTEAAKTAAITGGTSLAVEPIAAGIKALAPGVKDIAGEKVPVRADTKLENAAPVNKLQKFDIENTQPAAKNAIGKIASDVPSKDIKLGQAATTPAKDLADRADQIRAQSQPVFKKLDELSQGDEAKFSDLQQEEKAARRKHDLAGVKTARDAQEKIIDRSQGQLDPKDYQNARANWFRAVNLDDVHEAINTKAVTQPTPVKFRPENKPDPGYINGKNFSKTIHDLSKVDAGETQSKLQKAGLSAAHIQNLQDLGTLLEKSGSVQEQGDALSKIVKFGKTAMKGSAGVATGGAGFAASAALGKIMTDEKAASSVVKALRSVVPAAAAQASRPEKSALDKALDDAGVPKNDDPLQRTIDFRKMAKDLPDDVKGAAQKAISAFSNSLVAGKGSAKEEP